MLQNKRILFFSSVFSFLVVLISIRGYSEVIKYDAGNRRDPMVPLLGKGGILLDKKTGPGDLNIEGIIFDPKAGSMVLINEEFYKEGDRIGEANIITIMKDRIILQQDDEEKTLWIREEIVTPGEKANDSNS